MKKRVALIFGGRSAEHEVSMVSALNIFNAMDLTLFEPILIGVSKEGSWYHFTGADVFKKHKALHDSALNPQQLVSIISYNEKPYLYILRNQEKIPLDCAFPIIHGTMGEDGTLQGYFKILNLAFVGCGVLSSALGMDKDFMKQILTANNINNSRYLTLRRFADNKFSEISQKLGVPFFLKPANAGSSVGVHKVKTEAEFDAKLNDAFLYDHKVIAEEFIPGREVECSVIGLNRQARASLPGELIVRHEFYSYEAKYIDAEGAQIVIPANLSEQQIKDIQNLAVRTYRSLDCNGFARVDFFIHSNGQIYVNEINTLPGFTQISMYPKMWEASGLSMRDLITQLIHLAFEKHLADSQLKMSF